MAEEESEINIAVVGESGVGKSCIVSSFCGNQEGETTEGQLINISFFFSNSSERLSMCFFTSGCQLQLCGVRR